MVTVQPVQRHDNPHVTNRFYFLLDIEMSFKDCKCILVHELLQMFHPEKVSEFCVHSYRCTKSAFARSSETSHISAT